MAIVEELLLVPLAKLEDVLLLDAGLLDALETLLLELLLELPPVPTVIE